MRITYVCLFCWLMMASFSCRGKAENQQYDSPKNGTIHISVDESFKPVIDEQIKVYEGTYPEAHIIPEYKSEADCFRDLQKDSIKLVIVARGLNLEENSYFKSKLSFEPQYEAVAYDAVSVIVKADAQDSVFTVNDLKDFLSGKDTSINVVVDGKNATSTVRFLRDSLLNGLNFGKNVMAAKNSKEVLDYVSENDNAVGFVGLSWVGNNDDPEQIKYRDKIKFALIECLACEKGTYAKPSQATISYGQYPLVRPLYFILKENATGLATGFTNFLVLERGQLVFKRSYLVPAKMYFGVRTSNIK